MTGKSSLLLHTYPAARRIDLLDARMFHQYSVQPHRLGEELRQSGESFVIIDEIQKVPALLDEVQALHELRGIRFALCGSSARKLKRGHGNLLGGRALRFELFGLCARETGEHPDLHRLLTHGTLPVFFLAPNPAIRWESYVSDYLKEEIAAEGLVRNLPPFARFLDSAALGDTEQVNFTNIARELGVSRETIRGYYEVLVDTLVGRFLPAFRKRPKRRLSVADKFYFHDVGVVNALARRLAMAPRSSDYGKAFENLMFHELCAYNAYQKRFAAFSFWRLSTGVEVDIIVNDLACAMEFKATAAVLDRDLKGLRELKAEHPEVGPRVMVSLDSTARQTDDGIHILPVPAFLNALWSGAYF